MSRIGRKPILLPNNVEVQIEDQMVRVKGPKGELTRTFHSVMVIEKKDAALLVHRPSDNSFHRSLHGLTRSLLANMVIGVTEGFAKTLEIHGVGYRAQVQGNKLTLQLGFSRPVEITLPPGIQATNLETFTPTAANSWLSCRFTLRGIDKEQLGQLAAEMRSLRQADVYKGKGMRYAGEVIRRKAGKGARTATRGK